MLFPLFLFSLPVVIADLAGRKIPNIYLCLLAYCLVPLLLAFGLGEVRALLFFLFATFAMSFIGMGMGDFKLLSIIGVWLNIYEDSSLDYFAALVLAFSVAHIIWLGLKSRSIKISIPMAPSIFLALGLYLSTR